MHTHAKSSHTHVKDPEVHVRVRWIIKAPINPAYTESVKSLPRVEAGPHRAEAGPHRAEALTTEVGSSPFRHCYAGGDLTFLHHGLRMRAHNVGDVVLHVTHVELAGTGQPCQPVLVNLPQAVLQAVRRCFVTFCCQ